MEALINKLERLSQNLKEYERNLPKRVAEILRLEEVSQGIINLIQTRIFEQGALADGEKLITDSARYQSGQKAYSIRNKKKKDYDHVTLNITGDFFEQWQLRVGANVSKVAADKIKIIYDNFQDSFNSSTDMMDKLGTLSPEEIELVSKRIILPYIEADFKQLIKDV